VVPRHNKRLLLTDQALVSRALRAPPPISAAESQNRYTASPTEQWLEKDRYMSQNVTTLTLILVVLCIVRCGGMSGGESGLVGVWRVEELQFISPSDTSTNPSPLPSQAGFRPIRRRSSVTAKLW
jgi:hypothetical protein